MTARAYHVADAVQHRVDAIEPDEAPRDGVRVATLGQTISLSIEGLNDYFLAMVFGAAWPAKESKLSRRRPSKRIARNATASAIARNMARYTRRGIGRTSIPVTR